MGIVKNIMFGTALLGLVALCGEGCKREETGDGSTWHLAEDHNPVSFYHDVNGDGIDEYVINLDLAGGMDLVFYPGGKLEGYHLDPYAPLIYSDFTDLPARDGPIN